VVLALLFAIPAVAVCVRAGGVSNIYLGTTYNFGDATGGWRSANSTLTKTNFYLTPPLYAQATSMCIVTSLGSYATSQIWKSVCCMGTGYYYFNISGWWGGIVTAAGLAEADIWFYGILKNLDTGALTEYWTNPYGYLASAIVGGTVQGHLFTCTWAASLTAGYHYGIGVEVKAYTAGACGTSIANAMSSGWPSPGTYGVSYYNIAVWSSGAAGCVLAGTNILMASGAATKPVERVKAGDNIVGYNTTTGSFVNEKVTSNTKTTVKMVEIINNGSLTVTPTDQPMYVKNLTGATFWLKNPADLQVGWQIFCPMTQSWVAITNIQWKVGKFVVWDMTVTNPYDFICNGFLLLDKGKK
jgi:hypothetical protein